MPEFLPEDYSIKARMIMFMHYAKNDFTPSAEEICCFWREMSVCDLDHQISEWGFSSWRELKESEHFGGLWNLPERKVLLFADFEGLSLSKIDMVPFEKAFDVAKLVGY